MGDHLAEAGVAVEGDHGAGVFGHRGVAVELQKTTGVGFHVAWDHPDAVGVMPGKIGGDQMVCDEGGFPWGTAEMGKQ